MDSVGNARRRDKQQLPTNRAQQLPPVMAVVLAACFGGVLFAIAKIAINVMR